MQSTEKYLPRGGDTGARCARPIFEQMVDWQNVITAYKAVRSTKKHSAAATRFHLYWMDNLSRIRDAIIGGTWTPQPYRKFELYNYTKRREIEAPAYQDRIVHHMIHQVLEPLFERRFIYDSYSCRKGKGNHAAVDRAEAFMRHLAPCHILQCDVSKFFPSVNHEVLMSLIGKKVRDDRALALIRRASFTSEDGRGIPIGAVTSQLFSNVYLDKLDHYLKDEMGVRYYLRYADDFLVFSKDKGYLRRVKDAAEEFLSRELKLSLNPKSGVLRSDQGLDFCGYRVWPTHRKARRRVVKSYKLKLRDVQRAGKWELAAQIMASYLAYAKRCNSRRTTINLILGRTAVKCS